MLVEFAWLKNDALVERATIRVTADAQCVHLASFHVAHQLCGDAARLVLSNFPPESKLTTVDLDMPIHDSSDWESIDMGEYTFAFQCQIDA